MTLYVHYIERMTEMMTDKLVAVSKDCDCNDGMTTKKLIT